MQTLTEAVELQYMFSGVAEKMVTHIPRESNSSADNPLRAIIDACVSNVAVLDESGSIIYASRAWSFEQVENRGTSSTYFESCRRFTQSESDEEANVTLADDIQHILSGE